MKVILAAALVLAVSLPLAGAAQAADDLPADCKTFLSNYDKCIDTKMPEAAREAARTAVQTFRQLMTMAHSMNNGDPTLTAKLCKDLQDEVKKQSEMQSFGCEW